MSSLCVRLDHTVIAIRSCAVRTTYIVNNNYYNNNYLKQALHQVCKPSPKLNSHKIIMLGNAWVARRTNVRPLPLLSSYFALVSAHAIKTGQCSSYITLQVTLCCLLSRPRVTNINYPALTTISSIIIWLVPTTHCLFHYVGHTLQLLN